jgi:N utilization substance protein B
MSDEEQTATVPKPTENLAAPRGAPRLMAVQALYQLEMRGGSADATIMEFLQHRTEIVDEDEDTTLHLDADRALFADLVSGVSKSREDLGAALDGSLDGGSGSARLEPLLRAILLAGAYELRSRDDIPAKVAISEYVHLTDAFFDGKEPGLVNAVLDRLARVLRDGEVGNTKTAGDGATH